MALSFQGVSKSSTRWGLASKIELRQQGTGSFVDVGLFADFQFTENPLSMPGDPSDTLYVYAIQYTGSFTLLQTGKNNEVAMLTGTAGTGLYDTDVELKITFKDGRVITLGAVSNTPLRLVPGYSAGQGEKLAEIPCTFQNTELVTSFTGKVA